MPSGTPSTAYRTLLYRAASHSSTRLQKISNVVAISTPDSTFGTAWSLSGFALVNDKLMKCLNETLHPQLRLPI